MDMVWKGVLPAITTPMNRDESVDFDFLTRHVNWLADHGCKGIVALGSLGESATLTIEEKKEILRVCVESVGNRIPVIAGISALSTQEAIQLTKTAESMGCLGLMVLPPYVYRGTWDEMRAHLSGIFENTRLSCMLYNNPIAYGTDFLPDQVASLAEEFDHLHAIKESSTDVRRITAIRALIDQRLQICVGVDDVIVEGMAMGAVGWVAGLVNAFPKESVELFELCRRKEEGLALNLYKWFLPLLRLDTVPKFVQLIKLAQSEVGMGSEAVRLPRMKLSGAERDCALATIREAIATRPSI